MACNVHDQHTHQHGDNCGHQAISHEGHTDYLHDGHLHHVHGDHVDEHKLEHAAGGSCSSPEHKCEGHESSHRHGETCGHDAVPHGDHTDYLVSGHLHNQHSEHCDHHGEV